MNGLQDLPRSPSIGLQQELFDASASADELARQEREEAARTLQGLLTEVFLHPEPAQQLLMLAKGVPAAHRRDWHLVTHTLLARCLARDLPLAWSFKVPMPGGVHTLSRLWDQPVLQQRWQRLISGLSAQQSRRIVNRARRILHRGQTLH